RAALTSILRRAVCADPRQAFRSRPLSLGRSLAARLRRCRRAAHGALQLPPGSEPAHAHVVRAGQWNRPRNFIHPMTAAKTIVLLILSNVFMTFAWYAHLRELRAKPLVIAILVSWGIALFEYVLQVPANRAGFGTFTLPQLKILQEVITLAVFVPFAVLYMRTPLTLNFLW